MEEHLDHLEDLPVFWRRAPGPCADTLHLHGMPTSSDDMLPFLAAHGGVAPDLPGFGRSGKPGHFPYTLEGYADFLERFLDLAGLSGDIDLVMHDWGAVGLAWAVRHPERVRRLVLIAPAPLLPETAWSRWRRVLARPLLGELAVGAVVRPVLSRLLRRGAVRPLPAGWIADVWRFFDPGTQRAVLRLHRATDPETRESLVGRLGDIRRPALVACGADDPYNSSVWNHAWGRRFADATVEVVPDAGHWPWLDQETLVGRVSLFLTGGKTGPG